MTTSSSSQTRHYRDTEGSLSGNLASKLASICPMVATALIFAAFLLHGAEGPILTYFFATVFLGLSLVCMITGKVDSGFSPISIVLMALLWVWYMISNSQYRSAAAPELATFLAAIAIWSLATYAGNRKNRREQLMQTLIIGSLAYSVWAFITYISSLQHVSIQGISGSADPALQLAASFADPDATAMAFDFFLVLATTRILQVWKRHYWAGSSRWTILTNILRYGLLALLLFVLSLTCLLMTGSRSGILIGVAGVAGLTLSEVLFWPGRTRRQVGSRLGLMLILITATIVSVGIWMDRFRGSHLPTTVIDGAALHGWAELGAYFKLQMDLWMQAPFFGHGAGSFADVQTQAVTAATAPIIYSPQAMDNILMRGLIEYGLVGTGISVLLLVVITRELFRLLAQTGTSRSAPLLALTMLWIWLTHGFIDASVVVAALLWFVTLVVGTAYGQAHSGGPDDKLTEPGINA